VRRRLCPVFVRVNGTWLHVSGDGELATGSVVDCDNVEMRPRRDRLCGGQVQGSDGKYDHVFFPSPWGWRRLIVYEMELCTARGDLHSERFW
jgi:hypothetical protein